MRREPGVQVSIIGLKPAAATPIGNQLSQFAVQMRVAGHHVVVRPVADSELGAGRVGHVPPASRTISRPAAQSHGFSPSSQ